MSATELLSWRTARRLTQAQAAAIAGCSVRAWQYWESGRIEIRPIIWQALQAVPINRSNKRR